MANEILPEETDRASAYRLWMKAPNPMVTIFKTFDVTNLVRLSRKRHLKFNMCMDYCILKAAVPIKEFYLLPVGDKLMRYEELAVNTMVKNRAGGITSCDLRTAGSLETFNQYYLTDTTQAAEQCSSIDRSDDCMVIGTSAVLETEIDGVIGMNSGIYNNPVLFWGRYRKKLFRYDLPVSFQFHHTQMDGAHAGRFLAALQEEINRLK